MARVDVKASGPWRTLEIVGGVIVIALALVAIADPQFTVRTFVILVAGGLVIGGLFRIGVGVYAMILPPTLRTLNTTGGIIAVVLGIAALLDLQGAEATLLAILALALLLVGALEIGVGVARHPPKWLRAAVVTLGVLTMILSGFVIVEPSIGKAVIATILALALLLVGVRNIVHGITGHHQVSTLISPSATAV